MKLEQYYQFMSDPRLLNEESLNSLEELVASYPYVENFRILYALNLLLLDDFKYQDNLHKAAIYSSDRKKLKYWVNYLIQQLEEDPIENLEEVAEQANESEDEIPKQTDKISLEKKEFIEKPESKKSEDTEEHSTPSTDEVEIKLKKEPIPLVDNADPSEIEKQGHAIRTKSELLKLVKKRLTEIEQEKQKSDDPKEDLSPEEESETFKATLIDRFIENQPSISRPDKTDFYDPQKEAIDSTLDEDDFFVTETLAHIHVQQGNYKKAIEIYRKLILKIPEKSTYFAAQIEELSRK